MDNHIIIKENKKTHKRDENVNTVQITENLKVCHLEYLGIQFGKEIAFFPIKPSLVSSVFFLLHLGALAASFVSGLL